MSSKGCEILIVGAGITGLTIAHELLRRGVEDILIIEKENKLGAHASGRNSGVLHAGVYYTPGTLKAKFCVQGNRLMKEFCRQKGLTLRETGKVIVTKDESELERLYELKRRAEQSGARVRIIDGKELNDIEPYASTCEKAIFSPDTAVINPKEVLHTIAKELESSGKVRILYGTVFSRLKDVHTALTQDVEFAQEGAIHFKKFINAAGAYADRVARSFGIGREYKILPFKGTYKVLIRERSFLVRGNVYPVPDLRNPFLGVHFTRGVDERVYIGPTAIPAFGRENYGVFDNLSLETLSILYRDGVLLFKDEGFRMNAASEIRKYSKRFFFEETKRLLKGLKLEDLEDTDKVGIRPQLVSWGEKKLVMDFLVVKDGDSLHVLNAISPAFTSSMAFAGYIADLFLGDKGVRVMNS
ncbi:MAG TPA: L-2-hydroxyglutarate oxidase [Thermodesulfobacteriota bacterium]|nr:L-2-hydroxyglutarate oxidase [Thermodesulfobacteriota bacterium]